VYQVPLWDRRFSNIEESGASNITILGGVIVTLSHVGMFRKRSGITDL
jgi:hypothetical protein